MKYLHCITFLSLFKLFFFDCIPEHNCPKDRGECHKNKCYCYEEFWTLGKEEDDILGFHYCNYAKQSRFKPLILEFFIPIGLSHYYWGNKKIFYLKSFLLFLPITFIILGFFKYKNDGFINPDKNIKNENENNEEELNLMSPKESNKEIYTGNNKIELYFSDDGNDNTEITDNLYSANHNKIPINVFDYIILFVEGFFTICYFIVHIIDLIGYSFGFYKDENNIPFANVF